MRNMHEDRLHFGCVSYVLPVLCTVLWEENVPPDRGKPYEMGNGLLKNVKLKLKLKTGKVSADSRAEQSRAGDVMSCARGERIGVLP